MSRDLLILKSSRASSLLQSYACCRSPHSPARRTYAARQVSPRNHCPLNLCRSELARDLLILKSSRDKLAPTVIRLLQKPTFACTKNLRSFPSQPPELLPMNLCRSELVSRAFDLEKLASKLAPTVIRRLQKPTFACTKHLRSSPSQPPESLTPKPL